MSEPEDKAPEASPPPIEPVQSVGGVPIAIIKGGTTSWAYDQELARRRADAERRRAHEDRTREIAKGAEGGVAHLGEQSFLRDMPRVVLFYMNRDGTVRQECISEITVVEGQKQGEIDLLMTLVCPRCLERGVPHGEAQLKIHGAHRKFYIREEPHVVKLGVRERVRLGRGEVVDLRTPYGDPLPVVVCGSVSADDIIRCTNVNCNWAVRIDESRVYEV
jgi:hypothetical protein